jgi:serine/threonine protein kinase
MIAVVNATTDPRAADLIGTALGDRYRVDAVIGSGGMGTVVRARDLRLKRDVAVKIMLRELVATRELRERFEREAESVARLEHPNVVAILDFGSMPDGTMYQVMQLLEGKELDVASTGPFEPGRAVALMKQILRGLEHAHRHGVVHRDLKPQNVFLARDSTGAEVVRILDFGLAKLESHEPAEPGARPQLTLAGVGMGTPKYMSPEQGVGSPVDQRTDIYSAGVLLYEMLAGEPPFSGGAVEIVRQHLVDDPPPLPDRVPTALQQVVAKMLAKSAAERYASATEVLEAFDALAPPHESRPVQTAPTHKRVARAPHVVLPTEKTARRRAPLVRAPLLVAALLCAVIVAWLVAPGATVHERIELLSDRVAQLFGRVTRPASE